MKGFGFLIWKLAHVFPPAEQIALWKEIGVQWVSIKVRDYVNEYNRYSGSNRLEDFLIACDESDIEVGTWHFIHTTNMAKQAQLVSEDIKQFNLKHLMIDAEHNGRVYPGAYWKTYPRYRVVECAKTYMDNLDVPTGFPVGLCSYRYPEVHREFPWEAFLNHPKMTMINPQVYWMWANNPGYQFALSLKQYRKLSSLPFIPVGAAYEEGGWEPTSMEIAQFKELCQEHTQAWSFYRWGQAKYHDDWLAAMKVEVDVPEPPPEPPPPPPPPPVFEIPKARLAPGVSALRIRSGPSTGYSTVGYVRPVQPTVEILERKVISDVTEWFRIGYGQWSAAKYNGTRYLVEL
jgi:hypothetical protein